MKIATYQKKLIKKLSCNFHLASFYLVGSFFRQSENESKSLLVCNATKYFSNITENSKFMFYWESVLYSYTFIIAHLSYNFKME